MSEAAPPSFAHRITGRWIFGATLLVYALVAAAFGVKGDVGPVGFDLRLLPMANGILNTLTTVFLLAAWAAIRRKQIRVHRRFIFAAFTTTGLFLVVYLTYHFLSDSTRYGGGGLLAGIYYFLLLTHVVLAAAIVPLVGTTLYRALRAQFARHARLARWTLPIWLYVSVTGVVVYWMLYHG